MPKKYEGQRVKCPQCAKKFKVEVHDAEPGPAPSAAPTPVAAPSRAAATTTRTEAKATKQIATKAVECPVCGNKERIPQDSAGGGPLKCSQCGCVYRE